MSRRATRLRAVPGDRDVSVATLHSSDRQRFPQRSSRSLTSGSLTPPPLHDVERLASSSRSHRRWHQESPAPDRSLPLAETILDRRSHARIVAIAIKPMATSVVHGASAVPARLDRRADRAGFTIGAGMECIRGTTGLFPRIDPIHPCKLRQFIRAEISKVACNGIQSIRPIRLAHRVPRDVHPVRDTHLHCALHRPGSCG